MADLVQFVDSVSASPIIRLDLNNEAVGWAVRNFNAPPPRLRRSVASNAMRDGIRVGSSSYDGRTLTITLDCVKADQDAAATELQKLARELDRDGNVLKYQPAGATKPVFFMTYRSDLTQIDDVLAQKAMRQFTIEVLAEPFAVGLPETLGPFTMNNDPAGAANPLFVDLTTVIGDVATPAIVELDTSAADVFNTGLLSARAVTAPYSVAVSQQAESAGSLGADTTNPGGGPDAAMSGGVSNNFLRTTFATTPGLSSRWTFGFGTTDPQFRGRYIVYAVVRKSVATDEIKIACTAAAGSLATTSPVTLPNTTNRVAVRVGIYSTELYPDRVGGVVLAGPQAASIAMHAQRVSGAGDLDWDCVYLVPATDSVLLWSLGSQTDPFVLDAGIESAYFHFGGVVNGTHAPLVTAQFSGGFPWLAPGKTNRLTLVNLGPATGPHLKTPTCTMNVYYFPRYLFVRPVAS